MRILSHRPIYLTKKTGTALPMPRHLLKIAQFVDQLYYLKDERNDVADALSRITLTPNEGDVVHPIYTTQPVVDTLPDENSPHALSENGLVDDTFLLLNNKQRDLINRPLMAPTFIPTTAPMTDATTSCVGEESDTDEGSNTPSTATRDSTSSARACNAIFMPQPTTVAQLSTYQQMRAAYNRDVSLQKWINYHQTSMSRCMPVLVECEDGTQILADVAANYMRILVPASLQRVVFDHMYSISQSLVSGMVWQKISPNGQDIAKPTKRRKPTFIQMRHWRGCQHQRRDLVGLLNPACEGKNTHLTVID